MANLTDILFWNINQTKGAVAKEPKNIYNNGIIRNAYDTYLAVIFNKKFILNSKSKQKINKERIVSHLDSLGINQQICRDILFDFWFGGGGGATINDGYIRFISAYEAYDWTCQEFDYRRSKILRFDKSGEVYYRNQLIEGSYCKVLKDFDSFGNFYSVVDKCLSVLHTYNNTNRYNLEKSGKNFEREMFYKISNDALDKIGDNDSQDVITAKREHSKKIFDSLKERLSTMFKSASNQPKIIQSSIEPIPVDTPLDLDKMVKYKDGLIREIALCCNVPASMLGISGSANRSQSEQDRDNLALQAKNYTNIFCDVANYWLWQYYPHLKDDLYFSWEESETDETLQIREQNQAVLEFYTQNNASFGGLGITVDKVKLVELANSVSIPDLFILGESQPEEAYEELLLELEQLSQERAYDAQGNYYRPKNTDERNQLIKKNKEARQQKDKQKILELADRKKKLQSKLDWYKKNPSFKFEQKPKGKIERPQGSKNRVDSNLITKSPDLEDWESSEVVKSTKTEIEKNLKRYIQSQISKKNRSKEDYETSYPRAKFAEHLRLMANQVVIDYNELNDTSYSNIDVEEFVSVTYDGIDKYQGIHKTIDDMIDNKKSYQEVAKTTLANLGGNLYIPLFNKTLDTVAVEDGADYIVTIAKNDQLVRKHHLDNQNKIWKLGEKQYWLEPNCRCNRIYGTLDELLDAGATNPNNYIL